MRNMRQHRDKYINIVVNKRKYLKDQSQTASSHKKKGSYPGFGIANYYAQRSFGEDDASISRHIKTIQVETKKRCKDHRIIEFAMEKTFEDRRSLITKN